MSSRPDVEARHRARRQATRRKILDTALALLDERPWAEIGLDDIMAGADLTRTAFYRHFDGRSALLLALLEDVGVRLADIGRLAWTASGDDARADLAGALVDVARTYARHGRLLGAVAEAAADDAQLRAAFAELTDGIVRFSAERIAEEVAAGRSRVADPDEVARALILMNEAYLRACFGRERLVEPDRAGAALAAVWLAAVYGPQPA